MTFRFTSQPLLSGLYEPEGIYLTFPFVGPGRLLQRWGDNGAFYGAFEYNGVTMKGHTGLDFAITPQAAIVAVDQGRVVEISVDAGGLERYVKVEHRWGESLYAFVGPIETESGRLVGRGTAIASAGGVVASLREWTLFHFAIRIGPFNRFDGYGGFTDPLPYLNPAQVSEVVEDIEEPLDYHPHPMVKEEASSRRP